MLHSNVEDKPMEELTATFTPSLFAKVETNQQLIDLWLYAKSPHTIDAYQRDINFFGVYSK
jgi:hypothetical protein